jgi:hypothetical protein
MITEKTHTQRYENTELRNNLNSYWMKSLVTINRREDGEGNGNGTTVTCHHKLPVVLPYVAETSIKNPLCTTLQEA